MSRKLLRTGLAACVLAGLLAAPAQAADGGQRSVADGFWRWLTEIWQTISWTVDPDGSNAPTISMGVDPNGDGPTSSGGGAEGDIHWTIDPNG